MDNCEFCGKEDAPADPVYDCYGDFVYNDYFCNENCRDAYAENKYEDYLMSSSYSTRSYK